MPVAPRGLNSLHLTHTASEAVEAAIRSVLSDNPRACILTFSGSSHGDTLATNNPAAFFNWPTASLPRPQLPYWDNQREN